jgi:hypothetical protein
MPDARGGFGSNQHSTIIRAVAETYQDEENRSACNKFVNSVVGIATRGRVTFPQDATANDIFDLIQKAPWSVLGLGQNAVSIAGVMAAHQGKLVIAAWKNPTGGSGRCAIVLDFTSSKRPPRPDPEKNIGELKTDRTVIAQGVLDAPEKSSEYMKISGGFSSTKLKTTVCSYIDIA